jgi:hypothetical protein
VLFHAALQRTFSAWRRLDRYTLQCVAASGQNGGAPDTLNVENLIRFALRHDAGLRNQLVHGVTENEVTATALDVLNTWRPMLKDYFAVDLRDDAGGPLWHDLPAPLTSAWPIRLCAVPLLLLRLENYVLISSDSVYDPKRVRQLAAPGDLMQENDAARYRGHSAVGQTRLRAAEGRDRSRTERLCLLRLPDVVGPFDDSSRWWATSLWGLAEPNRCYFFRSASWVERLASSTLTTLSP